MADDKIKAYDRHGEKITIDKSEVGKLYALGGKLATKADISAHDVEAEYAKKSTAEKVAGLAVNASPIGAIYSQLSGNASLPPELEAYRSGVAKSTVVLPHAFKGAAGVVGGDEAAKQFVERQDRYQEASPVAAGLGEAAGTIGGALVGSGVGAVGKAAKFASPVGSVINSAGNLAERGVAGVLGSAAERGVLARAGVEAAKVGARGAVEGALYSGAQSASEDLLHDRDVAVDKLFAASGTGAAYGFGGGFLLGGASSLASSGLGAARQKIAGMLAPKAEQAAVEGVAGTPYRTPAPENAADKVARTYLDNVPGNTAVNRAEQAEAWANRERVFANHGKQVEDASRSFSTDLNHALESGRMADMASFGESKINQMSRLVDKSLFTEQAHAAMNWAADAHAILDGISKDATAGMGPTALKKWNGHVSKIAQAIEAGDAVQLHTALDNTKRFVGHEAGFGKGPFGLTVAQREFDNLYQGEAGIKGLLESPVWGQAASSAQRDINAATHEMLSQGKLFTRKFTTEFGSDAGRPLYAADTAAVSGFMNRLTSAANDLDAKGVESWIGARRKFLDAIGKNYEFEAGAANAIAKERQALDRLEKTYRQTTQTVSLGNKVKEALAEEKARSIGGAMGAVLDVANKPYSTLQRLSQLEATSAGISERVRSREVLGKWLQKTNDLIDRASKGFLQPPASGLPKASDRMPPAKLLATKALATVADFQRDPEAYVDKVTRQVESIAAHDPDLADALVQRHVQAQTFLASKVPVTPDPDPLDPHPAPKMTPNEQAEFGRYAWYTEKPARFFAEVARGKLTFEGAETAKALMPRAFAELQSQTEEHLATMMAKGSKIPYRQRQYLGVLLDMAATPSQRPDHAAFLQANVSQDEPPPPPPKRSLMNGAKSHMSALDRLESNGVGRR